MYKSFNYFFCLKSINIPCHIALSISKLNNIKGHWLLPFTLHAKHLAEFVNCIFMIYLFKRNNLNIFQNRYVAPYGGSSELSLVTVVRQFFCRTTSKFKLSWNIYTFFVKMRRPGIEPAISWARDWCPPPFCHRGSY